MTKTRIGKLLEISQNKEWGFYGTVKSNFDLTDPMVDQIWDYMVNILRNASPHTNELKIEEFLDSVPGRHLADELTFFTKARSSDINAIKKGIDEWVTKKSSWVKKYLG
jgi:hypothetical protein